MKKHSFLFVIFFLIIVAAKAQEMKPDTTKTQSPIQISAEPEGGINALYQQLGKIIRYPVEAGRAGTQGKVYVSFVINEDGSLSDYKVVKGIGNGCDEESIRALQEVSKIVKWKPSTLDGVPIKQNMALPVTFKIGKHR